MAELDTDVARALAALRSDRNPSAANKRRVLARLEASVAGPEGDGFDDGGLDDPGAGGEGVGELGAGPQVGAGKLAFATKVVAATASLTGAGLLALKLGVVAVRSLAPTPEPVEVPAVERVTVGEPAALDEPARAPTLGSAPTTDVESEPARPIAPASASRPAAHPSVPTPAASASSSSDVAAVTSDTLAAELALIDAARHAGSSDAAIAKLREHAEQFPTGALRDEREALWAIASCEREELDDARRRAEALAARRPSSPLLERIAKACPAARE